MKFEGKNLSCIRGGKLLFRKINFSLSAGQAMYLRGQNGAGKTSLLKILAGLHPPEKGALYWNDKDISQIAFDFRSAISYLGHKDGIRKALTPYENIKGMMALAGEKNDPLAIEKILIHFKLHALQSLPCEVLSKGQQRKVMLAAMILKQKKLWILDEPFTAIDKESQDVLQQYLDRHLSRGGMIIITSHGAENNDYHQVVDLSC